MPPINDVSRIAELNPEYYIAVKYSERHRVTDDWMSRVKSIPGISVCSDGLPHLEAGSRIITFDATPAGLATLQRMFGESCLIDKRAPSTLVNEALPPIPPKNEAPRRSDDESPPGDQEPGSRAA